MRKFTEFINDPDFDPKKTLKKARGEINYNLVDVPEGMIKDLRNKYGRTAVYKLKNGDVVQITAARFKGGALGDLTGIQKITLDGDRLRLNPIDYKPKLKGAKFIIKDWVTYMSKSEKDKIKKEL